MTDHEKSKVEKIMNNCRIVPPAKKCRCKSGVCLTPGGRAAFIEMVKWNSHCMIQPLRSTQSSVAFFQCLICNDGEHMCTSGYENLWHHIRSQDHFIAVSNFEEVKYKHKSDSDNDHKAWLKRCGLEKKHDGLAMTKRKKEKEKGGAEPGTLQSRMALLAASHIGNNSTQPNFIPMQPVAPVASAQPVVGLDSLLRGLGEGISGLTDPQHRRA